MVRAVKTPLVLLAVAILAACTASTQTASTPSPSRSTDDYGSPPAGVPLIYVNDPHHPGWYVGVDWNARPRATIKLRQPLDPVQPLGQAPDGSAFMIPPFKGLTGAFLDRFGAPIVDPDAQSHGRMMWGDDSTRVCTLDATFTGNDMKGRWVLGLKTPGSAAAAHPVALDTTTWSIGIEAEALASCSPRNDRAVLDYNWYGRPIDIYVARLSDGAVLMHERRATNLLGGITASADSTLIAENSSASIGALQVTPAPHTTVRRVADGSVVAELDPGYFVVAFSGDDTLGLVSTSPLASGTPTNLALVRLSDLKVLWQRNSGGAFGGSWVSPDGNDVAYQLGPPGADGSGPVELVIVHPDGTAASFRLQ